ncbi:hypothetical protein NIES970_26450 [[Synechococcus] sp. NIES-970]|nr:hypothetical protein NIES970_26450 [[Synechococcus] sp. NIES-970]
MDSQITSKYFVSSDRIKSELALVETPVDWQGLVDKKILEQKEKNKFLVTGQLPEEIKKCIKGIDIDQKTGKTTVSFSRLAQ